METHTTGTTRRGGPPPWASVIFFACAALNLALARWLAAAFFLASGLFLLKHRQIERQTKPVRFLIVATLAVLAAAMFIKLIFELKARG